MPITCKHCHYFRVGKLWPLVDVCAADCFQHDWWATHNMVSEWNGAHVTGNKNRWLANGNEGFKTIPIGTSICKSKFWRHFKIAQLNEYFIIPFSVMRKLFLRVWNSIFKSECKVYIGHLSLLFKEQFIELVYCYHLMTPQRPTIWFGTPNVTLTEYWVTFSSVSIVYLWRIWIWSL